MSFIFYGVTHPKVLALEAAQNDARRRQTPSPSPFERPKEGRRQKQNVGRALWEAEETPSTRESRWTGIDDGRETAEAEDDDDQSVKIYAALGLTAKPPKVAKHMAAMAVKYAIETGRGDILERMTLNQPAWRGPCPKR